MEGWFGLAEMEGWLGLVVIEGWFGRAERWFFLAV